MFKQGGGGGGKGWPIIYSVAALLLLAALPCTLATWYMRGSITAKGDWIIDATIYLAFGALVVLALVGVTLPLAIMARSRAASEVARAESLRASGAPMVFQMPTQSAPALPPPRVEEPKALGAATPWTVREAGAIVRR